MQQPFDFIGEQIPHLYLLFGASEGNRTLVFSLASCSSAIELHPRNIGASGGNRTHVFSLEDCGSTIELHPLTYSPIFKLGDVLVIY